MLSHETTRRSFGARRDLPFSELLDAPTFPGPLDVSLAALETQCLVTLAEAFARLRAAVEAGDDAATVEARRALALTSGVSMYDIEGRTFTARAQAFVEECAQLLDGQLTPALLGDYLCHLVEQLVADLDWTRAWADHVAARCGHLRDQRLGSIAATEGWFEDLDPARLAAAVAGAVAGGLQCAAEDVWLWRYDAEEGRGLIPLLRNGQSVSAALWEGMKTLQRWANRVGHLARRAEEAASKADERILAELVEEWNKRTFQGIKQTTIGLNRGLTQLATGACAEELHGTRPGMRALAVGFAEWLAPRALQEARWADALRALEASFPAQKKTLASLSAEKLIARLGKRLTSELQREERRYGLPALRVPAR